MEKTIKLKCKCGKIFTKRLSEYKRQQNIGINLFFCSRICSGLYGGVSPKDKFSPYRIYLRRIKRKNKNMTLEYLKEVFEIQKGKCIYTGINLIHPLNMVQKDYIYMASLDRIDSNKGYEIGNVQFISACMNYAKNNMSHEKAKEFIEVIRNGNEL